MSPGFRAVLGALLGVVLAVTLLAVGLSSVHEGQNTVLLACLIGAVVSLVGSPLLAARRGRRR